MEFYTDGSLLLASGDSSQAAFDPGEYAACTGPDPSGNAANPWKQFNELDCTPALSWKSLVVLRALFCCPRLSPEL